MASGISRGNKDDRAATGPLEEAVFQEERFAKLFIPSTAKVKGRAMSPWNLDTSNGFPFACPKKFEREVKQVLNVCTLLEVGDILIPDWKRLRAEIQSLIYSLSHRCGLTTFGK